MNGSFCCCFFGSVVRMIALIVAYKTFLEKWHLELSSSTFTALDLNELNQNRCGPSYHSLLALLASLLTCLRFIGCTVPGARQCFSGDAYNCY